MLKQSEANRALLRDKLPAEQRKLVLRIVDDLTMRTSEESQDSFLCGFKLAWQLANELNHYDYRRSTPAMQAKLMIRRRRGTLRLESKKFCGIIKSSKELVEPGRTDPAHRRTLPG